VDPRIAILVFDYHPVFNDPHASLHGNERWVNRAGVIAFVESC
jgi:hypothetical protein